jgi:hypothetical protein
LSPILPANSFSMYRILFFLAILFIPAVFSWWFFIPIAILSVYLFKLPFEIILAGSILDAVYYFGDGFFAGHVLTLFSFALIILALFLNERIHWRKVI